MSLLRVQVLSVRRGGRDVLRGASLTVDAGEVVGLIGPNGAGKTTLLRAAMGLLTHQGTSSLATMTPAERGRAVAWMPQSREIAWPVAVEMIVMLGRVPHLAGGQKPQAKDTAAVASALARMGLSGMGERAATALSSGEQARVLIARVLAQNCPLILADEPVAGLDPGHQIATMEVFRQSAAEGGAVLVSLHDLGLAARHCSRLILMQQGEIIDDGPPTSVLTAKNLREVFGIAAHLTEGPEGLIFQPLEVLR